MTVAPETEKSSSPYLDAANALEMVPSNDLRTATGGRGDQGLPLLGHTLWFLRDARALVERKRAQYGPNFRIELFRSPILIVGEPDAVRTVLMDKERNFSNRLGWFHAIGELFARGLMLRDFEEHRVHRRIMQVAFRADAMRGYAELMNPIIERGLDAWAQRTQSEFRFYDAIKQLTLDIGAEVFVGTQLGPEADRVNQAFTDSVQASIALVKYEVPFLAYRRGMNGRRLLEEFFATRIDARRAGERPDMFSQFCRAKTDEGESFDDTEIVDHMIFLLMAAHDTTTSSLSSLVWALAQHPEWQDRLRQQFAEVGERHLRYEHRDVAPQSDWALKEALRLFPPVPFIGRRAVRACQVGDVEVPANTAVSVCSLVTHYLPELFPEPERFDPERFSPEVGADRQHTHAFYPFGGGAHTCIGMHFANLQIKSFLHQFLRRFRVSLPPGHQLDMQPIPIPRPKDGLPVLLEELS